MSDVLESLSYLDEASFCMVCMTVLDEATEKVKLAPIYGTAKVLSDRVVVEELSGRQHVIPDSALSSIYPSDGNEILKDADHYVVVKIGSM